ncbi:hypothetical protein [Nannocystis pusilla]|uniref:hypothetical protein n=1 Tax=Nannocystis pusilla TaxID=889268 RepID=UPI003B7DFD53
MVMRAVAARAEVEGSQAGADANAGGSMAEAPQVVASVGDGVEAEGPAEDVAGCQLDLSPDGDPARWRRGRAQMFAGAAFFGVGVVGLGVMVSGWYVQRFSANELSRGTGYSDEALAPCGPSKTAARRCWRPGR